MWFAMLEKGIKDKRITEDDAVAANAIIGFTRKVLDHQEDLRKYYDPEDIYDLFADELETACRFIAWAQFRCELPLEAAKTAYATVVAKRDRRTYKATKSGVVFVFDEQAKVYESYYKAQLKNANTKSGKPSDDEERALEGKTSVAAATKALAQQKRENERLRRNEAEIQQLRDQVAQQRAYIGQLSATLGGGVPNAAALNGLAAALMAAPGWALGAAAPPPPADDAPLDRGARMIRELLEASGLSAADVGALAPVPPAAPEEA